MNNTLTQKLKNIEKIFDFHSILKRETDPKSIANYYRKNFLAYSIFHNSQFIHFGLSDSGQNKAKDLLGQAKIISALLKSGDFTHILELAAGRAANSIWLAKQHPEINFTASDLPRSQLGKTPRLKNLSVVHSDFHDLRNFKDNSFDLVFIVEALCHSSNPEKVIAKVKSILKPNGYFVVIDGFRSSNVFTEEEELAAQLTEKSMRVPKFQTTESMIGLLNQEIGNVNKINLTTKITPSVRNLERFAVHFFRHPQISKLITKIFGAEVCANSIAGYLLGDLIDLGKFEYLALIAQNKNSLNSSKNPL